MTCSTCGATAADGARFCANCGRALHSVDDERRVVTVLFADLVGFTALSERLDPERVKNIVDRCFERLATDITDFGGQVDKIVGDAIVALFGAPVAHEDDAERAVRAALRMQDSLADEAATIGQDLQIRVGVNTGEVLVGAMRAAGSVTAMGDVVNTASRLQTAAGPGEVLVGTATHAATAAAIAYESRGLLAARGREEPVDTWRALAPISAPGYRARRVDVPLVGRNHELGLLRHAVSTSITHGRALLLLLVGDVGLGKSRLADELAAWATDKHGALVREGRCLPYGEANVWWPVAEALRDGLGVADAQDVDDARAAVAAQVAAVTDRAPRDPDVVRTTAGLLTLLGYDPPGTPEPATVRQDAGRALGRYAAAVAATQPLLLEISDLHWADEAVLGLLDDIFATVHHQPFVVVATARPGLLDEWTPRSGRHNVLVLHLDPLARPAALELLHHLAGEAVPEALADVLLDRSGGNPFFLEELVSRLDQVDGSGGPVGVDALPDTLRGLVAARLDDLDPVARAVLQNAAVIGQVGPVAGLREMGEQLHRGVDVDAGLAVLVAAEIMELDGPRWAFRSELVREVAYQTITKADRAKYHLGIGQYLEAAVATRSPRPAWVVDQLAHHYGCAAFLAHELGPVGHLAHAPADLTDQARRWATEAAARARRDQALPTAVRLYGQALELGALDDGTDLGELADLHLARGDVACEAWDLATARTDVDAALALAEQAADPARRARARVVLGGLLQKEGDPDAALASLADAADEYRRIGDTAGLAESLRQRGFVELVAGRLAEAEASASEALDAFAALGDRSGEAWALQNLAWIAFVTGRAAEADERVQAAIATFSDLVDTRGMGWSLGLLAWIRFQQRRIVEAEALCTQVLDEARSRNDPWANAMMTLLSAAIHLWTGRTAAAVDLATEARRAFLQIGDPYGLIQASSALGRGLVMIGRVEEGFALLRATREELVGPDARPLDPTLDVTRIATALQIGEPQRLADIEDRLAESAAFDDDLAILRGLLALQRGDVAEAGRHLGDADAPAANPNLVAVRALWAAAAHTGRAADLAARIEPLEGATYLDRALGALAAALEWSAAGRRDEAAAEVTTARSLVDATSDEVARPLVALVAAAVSGRSGDPNAEALADAARTRFAELGIEPEGWVRIIGLATELATPVAG